MSDHRVYRIGPGGLPPGEHDAETDEGWSMAKLRPFETGLPMTVWITENDHYPHDVRVKVSTIHGGRGSWRHDALFVAVRPQPRELVPGILPARRFPPCRRVDPAKPRHNYRFLGRQAQCDRVACPPAKTVDAMKSRCQPRAAAVRARPARGTTQAQETAQSPHPAARPSRAPAQPRQGRPRAISVSDTSAAEVVTSPRRLFPPLQEMLPCARGRI